MQFFKGLDGGFYWCFCVMLAALFLASVMLAATYPIKEAVMSKRGYEQKAITVTTTKEEIIWVKIKGEENE
jgi:hypothetical protein